VTTPTPEITLLGRRALLGSVRQLLVDGKSVLLVGPAGIGKTALIRCLTPNGVMVIDPFERVSAHRAARVRRGMERGTLVVGAARTPKGVDLGKGLSGNN
jgi:ABC-type branched-subunit amino acid transport system ATPase component